MYVQDCLCDICTGMYWTSMLYIALCIILTSTDFIVRSVLSIFDSTESNWEILV